MRRSSQCRIAPPSAAENECGSLTLRLAFVADGFIFLSSRSQFHKELALARFLGATRLSGAKGKKEMRLL